MKEKYILSIWKNYEDPKEWLFDNCPLDQFLRNATHYLLEYKKPYYYSPIFIGSQNDCDIRARLIAEAVKNSLNNEELERFIRAISSPELEKNIKAELLLRDIQED